MYSVEFDDDEGLACLCLLSPHHALAVAEKSREVSAQFVVPLPEDYYDTPASLEA